MNELSDEEIEKINEKLPEGMKTRIEKGKTYKAIACNNCHKSDTTLIKATDSYYCKFCFDKLGKEKYKK